MIYSDDEHKRWWASLSESEKNEIFDRIEERASSDALLEMVSRIRAAWMKRYGLTPKQIETLRKWS